jgi:glycerol-3-phosphate O-acyltransferase/dihydroxyacetone phosphate acyltransferase
LISYYYSEIERRKAVAASKVKVLGKDVVASYKIIASAIVLPTSIIIYTILFYLGIRKRVGVKAKFYSLLFLVLWPIYVSCTTKKYNYI